MSWSGGAGARAEHSFSIVVAARWKRWRLGERARFSWDKVLCKYAQR